MQPFSKSSFIPKKTIQRVERTRGRKRVYVLAYVSYAMFFGSLIAIAGIFGYTVVLEGQLQEKIDQLAEQRATYSESDFLALKDWEHQIRLAEYFFYNHLSPYKIFSELERETSSDIRFSSFNYTAADEGAPTVRMNAETDRFDSVAFQRAVFGPGSIFSTSDFTGVTKVITPLDENGQVVAQNANEDEVVKPVNFEVEVKLTSSDLSYEVASYRVVPAVSAPSVVEVNEADTTGAGDETLSDITEQEI